MPARPEGSKTKKRYVALLLCPDIPYNGYEFTLRVVPAFILYRQHYQASVVASNPGLANPQISKVIGDHWRNASDDVKNHWRLLAEVSVDPPHFEDSKTNMHLQRRKKHVTKSNILVTDTSPENLLERTVSRLLFLSTTRLIYRWPAASSAVAAVLARQL